MRVLVTLGIRGIVVVRSYGLGNAPISHRQFRIEFRGVLKRSCSLIVVESIDKAQSLIKELLRLADYAWKQDDEDRPSPFTSVTEWDCMCAA